MDFTQLQQALRMALDTRADRIRAEEMLEILRRKEDQAAERLRLATDEVLGKRII